MATEVAERINARGIRAQSNLFSEEDASGVSDVSAAVRRRAVRKARSENRRAVTRFKNDLITEMRARIRLLEKASDDSLSIDGERESVGPDAAAGIGPPCDEALETFCHAHADGWSLGEEGRGTRCEAASFY